MKKIIVSSIIAAAMWGITPNVSAHGYLSEKNGGVVGSRAYFCKYATSDTNEKNRNCGAVQWEPQSVEGPDGFPEAGPADGQIASAGLVQFSELNEQTSDRWIKRPISSGPQTFEWTFTANHITRSWKYYITKKDWNPNAVLTRDSFELTPFCELDFNMQKPPRSPQTFQHECVVPEREGYHVILAVWDVGDTAAAFYNVIDVMFESGSNNGNTGSNNGQGVSSNWVQSGVINPIRDLNIGDRVYTRVFDQAGENHYLSTELVIETEQQGLATNWTYALATKINKEQKNIASGHLNDKGDIVPAYSTNPIYARANSGIQNVELGYDIQEVTPYYALDIQGLNAQYTIADTATELDLSLYATGEMEVELTVYNHHKEALANEQVALADGDFLPVTLELTKSEPGHHMLVTRIKNTQGELIEQTTVDFFLVAKPVVKPVEPVEPPKPVEPIVPVEPTEPTEPVEPTEPTQPNGDYDYAFPDNIKNYKAGTKVLAADGNVYQCKSFPYSGYCVQWSASATQFEPGVGTSWALAWDKVSF